MKRLKNVLYPTLFAIACAMVSCVLHKPALPPVKPVYPIIEQTSNTFTPPPIPAVYRPSTANSDNRYKEYRTFKDSVLNALKSIYSKQDVLANKQDGITSKLDTGLRRQLAYTKSTDSVYSLLARVYIKNEELERLLNIMASKATVSTKTKKDAQFSTAFVKNALQLNLYLLVFIVLLIVLNIIFTLKRFTYKPNL